MRIGTVRPEMIKRNLTFRGLTFPISFSFGSHGDLTPGGGWINGQVNVNGTLINVGGGWVDDDGSVTGYAWSEMGDLDTFLAAMADLGVFDDENKDDVTVIDEAMAALHAATPTYWEIDD